MGRRSEDTGGGGRGAVPFSLRPPLSHHLRSQPLRAVRVRPPAKQKIVHAAENNTIPPPRHQREKRTGSERPNVGTQELAHVFGGRVAPCERREYGRATARRAPGCDSALFRGLPEEFDVWMSHGDKLTEVPRGFRAVGELSKGRAVFVETGRGRNVELRDPVGTRKGSRTTSPNVRAGDVGRGDRRLTVRTAPPSDRVRLRIDLSFLSFDEINDDDHDDDGDERKPARRTRPTSPSRTSRRGRGGYSSTRR
jgi:hypothetical protein